LRRKYIMSKDLSSNIKAVYAAVTLEDKLIEAKSMVDFSSAKEITKTKAYHTLGHMTRPSTIDLFMTNYMLSGEGMSV
jgi:hypothetical protein